VTAATVRNDEQAHRYEIVVDDAVAGFVTYRDRGDERALLHTEVDRAFEGRGLASRLIRAALEDARSRGLAVLPHCPFVRSFIGKHPEYVDLVPASQRDRFGLGAAGGSPGP
jgi:predicted GNAT family acetyltransferase